MEKTFRKKN